ncbi:hypothetical protein QTP70_013955 [Hemibagrus guttatus]|uniref:Uncharacterized protein n=1 Tax=Hemibagrus guttatus TaxID=175788 RepID=A0AAE0RFE4_9TELE|nr:hypothetical protein QTP70_013955 [Hemibagrus guttatus]
MGKFGVKERNLEGQMVVDFAKRMDMGVVNTYFQKREEHRVTYKSGGDLSWTLNTTCLAKNNNCCMFKATSIVDDPSYPSHGLFTLLPSGRRADTVDYQIHIFDFGTGLMLDALPPQCTVSMQLNGKQ